MNKVIGVSLVLSIVAMVMVVAVPINIQYESKQALKRQAEREAKVEDAKRQPPDFGCSAGGYRVTDYSGSIMVSIPVWAKNGPVTCKDNGYFVNGELITKEQVDLLAMAALNQNRDRMKR